MAASSDQSSEPKPARSNSISQASEDSQTAQQFIESQLQLEADAREALPYQFDTCTRQLGALRQALFSCLTCNPPPSTSNEPYNAAGVCYSCSISCHGEHTLVELFNKRNFICDCGTTRYPSTAPCTLRISEKTGTKGNVHSEKPAQGNTYNQNFRNRFCACEQDYDPHKERGTMFQCLGLGTVEEGGCGEDWYHPECIMGLPRDWKKASSDKKMASDSAADVDANGDTNVGAVQAEEDDSDAVPAGFPSEDDFEYFICFKCVEAFPWIKRYAGTKGFLKPVYYQSAVTTATRPDVSTETEQGSEAAAESRKRKAFLDVDDSSTEQSLKRQRSVDAHDDTTLQSNTNDQPSTIPTAPTACRYQILPPAPSGKFSLFMLEDFRPSLCRCASCYPLLAHHRGLLDEEETYEPPLSSTDSEAGAGSLGSGARSLLERGEAALSNVDRVRAIEGVMVYNHLKSKVKDFLKPFAESGTPVGAEDIKRYFESLRGDAEAIRTAGMKDGDGDGGEGGDNRKEQSGY